jgi:hypothetical protein
MGLLFLVALHVVKDLYLALMKFHGFPSNEQILREVRLRSCDLILLIT